MSPGEKARGLAATRIYCVHAARDVQTGSNDKSPFKSIERARAKRDDRTCVCVCVCVCVRTLVLVDAHTCASRKAFALDI